MKHCPRPTSTSFCPDYERMVCPPSKFSSFNFPAAAYANVTSLIAGTSTAAAAAPEVRQRAGGSEQ